MPESAHATGHRHAGRVALLRIVLALAYPFTAHAASVQGDGALAAVGLGIVVLTVLADGLLLLQWRSWLGLFASTGVLVAVAQSRFALLPLLLVPVAFVAMVAWWFGRTLGRGRVPLITRILSAIERKPPEALEPVLYRYTRGLTLAWTVVLAALGAGNLLLALLAEPRGLLAQFGIDPPVAISQAQWSWFANGINYGLVGGFFVLEYLYRKRRFPGRYRNFMDFGRRLASLGPAFWRDLMR